MMQTISGYYSHSAEAFFLWGKILKVTSSTVPLVRLKRVISFFNRTYTYISR